MKGVARASATNSPEQGRVKLACLSMVTLSKLMFCMLVLLLTFSCSLTRGADASSFHYDYGFASSILNSFDTAMIDVKNGKLYVGSPGGVIVESLLYKRDQDNIVTRWDIHSGKCEALTRIQPPFLWFEDVSPEAKWLLLMLVSTEDMPKFMEKGEDVWNHIPVKFYLLAAHDLSRAFEWRFEPAASAFRDKASPMFADIDTLIYCYEQKDKNTGLLSSYVSVWSLSPKVAEVNKLKIPGTDKEEFKGLSAYRAGELLVFTSTLDKGNNQSSLFVRVLDIERGAILLHREIAKAPLLNNECQLSLSVLKPESKRFCLSVEDGYLVLDENYKEIGKIDRPVDEEKRRLHLTDFTDDSKYFVFHNDQLVMIYDFEKREFFTLDDRIPKIRKRWRNPPPFTKLWQAMLDPRIRFITNLNERLLSWVTIRTLANSRRAVGFTSYGQVVVWDLDKRASIKEFRVAEDSSGMDAVFGLE